MSKIPQTRLFTTLVVISLAVGLLSACNNKDESDTPPTEVPVVNVQLYLGAPQIEYAGIYAAMSQGYFEDEKLNLEVLFAISADAVEEGLSSYEAVSTGGPVFADGTAEGMLRLRQADTDFVSLLTLYQRDSRSIVSIPPKDVETPQELVGKRLLVVPGTEYITTIFLSMVGVAAEDVTIIGAEGQGVDWLVSQMLTGAVDAMVFSIEGATQLEAAGLGSTRIAFYDYGVQSYANVVFTSGQMVKEHPDVVQRFVNAVLRGLHYVTEHPQEVAAWFVEHYGDQLHPLQLDVQDEAILAIIPLIQTATSQPGMMSPDTWEYLNQQMVELGLLEPGLNSTDTYTLKFLDAYYNAN